MLYSWKQGPALPECEPKQSEAFCECHHPVTFHQLQKDRMFWSEKYPQWSLSPALKWIIAHTGIKPTALILVAPCSNKLSWSQGQVFYVKEQRRKIHRFWCVSISPPPKQFLWGGLVLIKFRIESEKSGLVPAGMMLLLLHPDPD